MDELEFKERHRKVSLYLCSVVSRINSLLIGGLLHEADNEIACAAVDVLWLADGNDLPDEFYEPSYMHNTEPQPQVLEGNNIQSDHTTGFKLV